MPEFDCDLQLHGCYASGVSKHLSIPSLAQNAQLKGLDVLVTADIQHAKWFQHVKENLKETSNGIFQDEREQAYFIVGTEVESQDRAHHLAYFPDLPSAQIFRKEVEGKGILDCVMCGRPKLHMMPEAIAQAVEKAGGIFGPSHAFTPYFGVYAHFDSAKKAYGEMGEKIAFLELGLSADSELADQIAENNSYVFLSSSDAHSAWPHRLGREFNRMEMKEPSFKELKKSIEGKKMVFNAGLNPREGKYHLTACNACYTHYTYADALKLGMKCRKCGSPIKRGVKDRILELSGPDAKPPSWRAPYKHLLPLAEIIQLRYEVQSPTSSSVQEKWKQFVNAFENEISVLLDVPLEELEKTDAEIARHIQLFREDKVLYVAGGGGNYGKPLFIFDDAEREKKKREIEAEETGLRGQKSLGEF
ncbi:MAG: endonuclease Q family protein [Candidatus Diapherotrites archaeon]